MERYDIRQGEWMAEKAEAGDFVLYADAQATIAALQDERDGWVRSREHYYQLWMRATDERDEMRKERDEFESLLTQRTAELEAATQHHEQSENAAQLYYRELTRAKNRICEAAGLPPDSGYEPAIKHLQAGLKRVREELADERTAYKALSEQYNRLDLEHSDLRTLLLALPKVEGEIRVEEGKVISVEPVRGADPPLWWRRTIATFEDGLLAKHYSKLLQHRQGMEG